MPRTHGRVAGTRTTVTGPSAAPGTGRRDPAPRCMLCAMRGDTGFTRADAEHDFLRMRRRQVLSRLAGWLRREPDDVNLVLPFDEVVTALGLVGERRLGREAPSRRRSPTCSPASSRTASAIAATCW